jgi:hypothetical protein
MSSIKKEGSEEQKYPIQLISQIGDKVGEQMRNVEGPDFEALTSIGAMVLMEENDVREIMGVVRDSIVEGTSLVVMDMKLEQRFQRAAINALQDGMRGAAAQFEQFLSAGEGHSDEYGPGFGTGGDYFFWEPVVWNKAVCCMPGMDCWNGDFANKAGREQLLADLDRFQGEYESAKAEYDVLNEENLIRQQEERSAQLAEGRDYSNKITNRISDNEKRLQKANTALADLAESELSDSPY